MKRWLAFILIIIMIFSMTPVYAVDMFDNDAPEIFFNRTSGDYLVGTKIKVSSSAENLKIFVSVDGYDKGQIDEIAVPYGYHTISARAEDNSGNVVAVNKISICGTYAIPDSEPYMNATFDDNDIGSFGHLPAYLRDGIASYTKQNGNNVLKLSVWKSSSGEKTTGTNLYAAPQGTVYADRAGDAITKINYNPNNDEALIFEYRYKYDSYWRNTVDSNGNIAYGTPVRIKTSEDLAEAFNGSIIRSDNPRTYRAITRMFVVPEGTTTAKAIYPFYLDESGKIATTVYEDGVISSQTLDIDAVGWHKYKVVADPTENLIQLYVNDALVRTGELYSEEVSQVSGCQIYTPNSVNAANTVNSVTGGLSVCVDDIRLIPAKLMKVSSSAINMPSNKGVVISTDDIDINEESNIKIVSENKNGYELKGIDELTSKYIPIEFDNTFDRLYLWDWSGLNPVDNKYETVTFDIQGEDIEDYDGTMVSVLEDSNASKGKVLYLSTSENRFATEEEGGYYIIPTADITAKINVARRDTYNIWIRTQRGSSYYCSFDDGATYKYKGWRNGGSEEPYFWEKLTSVYLEPGEFRLKFAHRHKTLKIDRIVITNDAGYLPEGADDFPNYDTTVYEPLPDLKPISGHPRLFVTPDTIDDLRENAADPEMEPHLDFVKRQASYSLSAVQNNSYDSNVPRRVRCRALWWLLGNGDDAYARQIIQYAKDYLATATFPKTGDITRAIGDAMYMGAIVYDWLYDYLTEEEKIFFISRFKHYAYLKEVGYPLKLTYIDGHSGEYEVFRDFLSVGIAIYDEDPEMYNIAAGAYFNRMAPPRRWLYQSGNGGQGDAYSTWRIYCELFSTLMFDKMNVGGGEILGEIWNAPMRYIYARKPDGTIFREGDTSPREHFVYNTHRTPEMFSMIANMYPDKETSPYVYGEWATNQAIISYKTSAFETLLAWDKDHPNEADLGSDLPLTYRTAYPVTQLYARTSWQRGLDAPTAMAFMQTRETLTGGHLHPDLGQFQIYYKGALALDAGGGTDGDGWLNDFDANYERRSISHNVMTVIDPDEVFFDNYYDYEKDWKVVANDGGQDLRLVLDRYRTTYEGILNTEDASKIGGVYIGPNEKTPEFSYVQTDLTNAYAGHRVNKDTGVLLQTELGFENKAGTTVNALKKQLDYYNETYKVIPKISDYKRSMVFIDLFDEDYPAAFICFDKIDSTNPQYVKKWLLHTEEEPEITDGNTTVVKRIELGFNGKMVVKTLLPEEPVIELVGGEGYEFYVDGKNYDATPNHNGSEAGKWRVEISPSVKVTDDMFLNAMYVTDYDRNLPELPMIKEDQGNYIGVTVKDRTVLFSKDAKDNPESFTLNVRDNNDGGKMSVMIADITPGMWKVERDTFVQYINVDAEECALFFKGTPGVYTISPSDVTEETAIEYPEAEKEKLGDFLIFHKHGEVVNTYFKGIYLYQPKPTKLVGGIPYLPVEPMAYYFGADAVANGNDVEIVKDGETFVLTADSENGSKNGTSFSLMYKPKMIDGTLYASFEDLEDVFDFVYSYDAFAKTVIIQ